MPDTDLLHALREGSRLTLTLNRPDRRNALNAPLVRALTEALRHAADDPAVRVIVLTGAGTSFSAGADLDALRSMQTASAAENLADSALLGQLFETIHTLSKPVLARVNGAAIGGGCGLATVCDISIIADDARIGFPEVRLGFVPAIVMVFARLRVGEAALRDLLLRGRLLRGTEAAALGLVTRSVPADQLDAVVDEVADELARETSGEAVALTKTMLAHVTGMGLAEAMHYAVHANALARTTADFQAGISAFLDKTDPPWRAA